MLRQIRILAGLWLRRSPARLPTSRLLRRLSRSLRCRLHHCPGRVVSGWRGGALCIGYACNDCHKVSHYEPVGRRSA